MTLKLPDWLVGSPVIVEAKKAHRRSEEIAAKRRNAAKVLAELGNSQDTGTLQIEWQQARKIADEARLVHEQAVAKCNAAYRLFKTSQGSQPLPKIKPKPYFARPPIRGSKNSSTSCNSRLKSNDAVP